MKTFTYYEIKIAAKNNSVTNTFTFVPTLDELREAIVASAANLRADAKEADGEGDQLVLEDSAKAVETLLDLIPFANPLDEGIVRCRLPIQVCGTTVGSIEVKRRQGYTK